MTFIVALGFGTVTGAIMMWVFPKIWFGVETRVARAQAQRVITEALNQVPTIRKATASKAEAVDQEWLEEEELALAAARQEVEEREQQLEREDQRCGLEQQRLEFLQTRVRERTSHHEGLGQRRDGYLSQLGEISSTIRAETLKRAGIDYEAEVQAAAMAHQSEHLLQAKRAFKRLLEEVSASRRKKASRVLRRIYDRYNPDFVWPKNTNIVEITQTATWSAFESRADKLAAEAAEIAGVELSLVGRNDQRGGLLRVSGGYGVDREALRLSLQDMAEQSPRSWVKMAAIYHHHREELQREVVSLGAKAVRIVGLEQIHPQVQELIGALNWRTSYRQNQWHHTLEVARLAGIIASELGMDEQAARRVGLLHDIGKAIDYRIEGSHAVISADYADRYGETRLICDTVMSHHADLIVETPLAYVLMAADTMSGARPGARVNLEEGYQIRLEAIADVVQSVAGVQNFAIMNGGREVHVQVDFNQVREQQLAGICELIKDGIEQKVAFPGQIKVVVQRNYEAVYVA